MSNVPFPGPEDVAKSLGVVAGLELLHNMGNPQYRHLTNPYTGELMYDSAGNPILERVPAYERPARGVAAAISFFSIASGVTIALAFVTIIITMLVKKAGYEDLSTALAVGVILEFIVGGIVAVIGSARAYFKA